MSKKGFVSITIILMIAFLVGIGISGYIYFQSNNKSKSSLVTTTTVLSANSSKTTVTTKLLTTTTKSISKSVSITKPTISPSKSTTTKTVTTTTTTPVYSSTTIVPPTTTTVPPTTTTVHPTTTTKPSLIITVISPNGFESWQTGSSHNINWNVSLAQSAGHFSIWAYSSTRGWGWYEIGTPAAVSEQTSYTYSWTVFNHPMNDWKIRVWYVDGSNNWIAHDDFDNFFTITAPPLIATTLNILIPSYFNGSGPLSDFAWSNWNILLATTPQRGIVSININNGPGDSKSSEIETIVNKANAANLNVLGYIHGYVNPPTKWSDPKRSFEDIKSDIDKYANWYGVKNILLDETWTVCENVQFFKQITDYIHQQGGIVAINAWWPPACYTDYMPMGDIWNIVETNYDNFQIWNQQSQPSWISNYPPSKFSGWFYNVDTREKMYEIIDAIKNKNIGWVYITSAGANGSNPWYYLPAYWEDEVNYIISGIKTPE